MSANPYYPTSYYPQYQPQQTYLPSNTQPNLASMSQRRSSLSGRIVNSETDVMPNDVIMDGSISLFPLSDYSAIIAKQWNANGTISTIKYIPITDSSEESDTNELAKMINQRFDDLEKKISERKYNGNRNNNSKKDTGESNV